MCCLRAPVLESSADWGWVSADVAALLIQVHDPIRPSGTCRRLSVPGAVEAMSDSKNCRACRFSYMEPSGPALLICGVEGGFGSYLNPRLGNESFAGRGPETPICGSDRPKFEQHPGRNPDGTLKGGSS